MSTFIVNQFGFAEMNLRFTGDYDKLMMMIRRAVIMGYDSIVINTDIGDLGNNMGEKVKNLLLISIFIFIPVKHYNNKIISV